MLFFDKDKIISDINRLSDINYTAELINTILTAILNGEIPESIKNIIPEESIRQINETQSIDESKLPAFANDLYSYIKVKLDSYISQINSLIQNTLKFACFSEEVTSAAMWGHYADSSKGFA